MDLRYMYILFIIFVIMSAFFSASETAFSTVNIIRLKTAKEEGKKGAKKALYIAENYEKTLSTILIGNNIVNLSASSLATILFIKLLVGTQASGYASVISTAVTTLIILLFGEIVPKVYAKEHSVAYCLRFSWLLYIFLVVFTPLSYLISKFTKLMSKVLKTSESTGPSVTEDELEVIIDTMEEEGLIEQEERKMLRNVLDLSETSVYDIMTPRVDMVGVYIDDDIEYIKDLFFNEKFSRIPVYKDSKDNVVGILNERDFFSALLKTDDPQKIKIEEIMKEPLFVTKSMHIDALIELLQRNKQHLAIVSDEYGGTSGLVTMEDCLEELVGEIYDEHDEEEYDIIKIDENNYEISASVDLEELFEELNLGKAPETTYSNLGGWLYQRLEDVPKVGDQCVYTTYIKIENDTSTMDDDEFIEVTLTFTVKELQDRRMKKITLNVVRNYIGRKPSEELENSHPELINE